MEKDLELIKRILEAVKENEGPEEMGMSQVKLGLQDIDPRVYAYHTKLLFDEGFILAKRRAYIADEYPTYEPYQTTGVGRSLLYDLSIEGKLKKTAEHFASAGREVGIAVIAEYLKRLTMP